MKREGDGGEKGKGKGADKENDDQAGKTKEDEDEDEVYSEPDEGVEILDMEKVKLMDWMAPETLAKERKGVRKIKKEKQLDVKGKGASHQFTRARSGKS